MRDFTTHTYRLLLKSALDAGYKALMVEDYVRGKFREGEKIFILRQDADRMPFNALKMAKLQHDMGVRSTYYFRVLESYHEPVMRGIVDLGHELGYHYEDVSLCGGDLMRAYDSFRKNLELFRSFYPVVTICMHGSPMSKFDNRLLWKKFNYRDDGIIAEPYFDIDFSRVLYITDTGRAWNRTAVSVRDKVQSDYHFNFQSTPDIASRFTAGSLPLHIMHNVHPHRWNDNYLLWMRELVFQNIKNSVKYFISRSREGVTL